MTDRNELLDAVQALTRPQTQPVEQEVLEDGKRVGSATVHVTTPALLVQMEEAIGSSFGGTTLGASDPSTRMPLNSGVMHQLLGIKTLVNDWCLVAKLRPPKNPADALDQWYVAYIGSPREATAVDWHIRKLHSWAGMIASILDPPRERELPDECPQCGAGEWWRDGEKYFHPLVIRYRKEGDILDAAKGACRACEATWSVRELAYELESKEGPGGA